MRGVHFDADPGKSVPRGAELSEPLLAFFQAPAARPARGFKIMDPFDHSSNGMAGTPTHARSGRSAFGDGARAISNRQIPYGKWGAEPQIRPITRPRAETLLVSVTRVPPIRRGRWAIAGPPPLLSFLVAPPAGAEIRAGFSLRCSPYGSLRTGSIFLQSTSQLARLPSIPLIELREAALMRVFFDRELDNVATLLADLSAGTASYSPSPVTIATLPSTGSSIVLHLEWCRPLLDSARRSEMTVPRPKER